MTTLVGDMSYFGKRMLSQITFRPDLFQTPCLWASGNSSLRWQLISLYIIYHLLEQGKILR